jgi:pimeloyl-ACP methyl ester carboxylesterase
MFNERDFIAQVEAASTQELAELLLSPTLEQEKVLRAHLGDDRYQRMHSMALKRSLAVRRVATRGGAAEPRGKVVVIHGIMGAELSVSSGGSGDLTWVSAFRVMRGWLDRLRLDPTGRREANDKFRVTASGIMKRYYGEMLLSLSERWDVQAFWFDWRKDLNLAADALNTKINEWFGNDTPVHIVAHSMGGLAARTFIANYPNRWRTMWDEKSGGALGGRLVMLGTPNMGSYAIPQVITGLEGLVRKLAMLDLRHSVEDLLETFNSFVGSYQMLPSPDAAPNAEALYNAGTYAPFKVTVSQQHLDAARAHHRKLAAAVDAGRMIYVAGYDQPTFSDIADYRKLNSLEGYKVTMNGDGRVPHELGLLKGVPTYYIREGHGELSSNAVILRTLEELLRTGQTTALERQLPASRAATALSQKSLREKLKDEYARDEQQIQISLTRMRGRGAPRSKPSAGDAAVESFEEEAIPDEYFSPEQRRLEESLTRGFLGRGPSEAPRDDFAEEFEQDIESVGIELGIVLGGIESLRYEELRTSGRERAPVDAVAVGHYIGVQPQGGEEMLDRSVTAALLGLKQSDAGRIPKSRLVLTQYTERGIINGKLGEPFMLPDPRDAGGPGSPAGGRVVVLAGMGEAGSFGAPELTVLARELCWALGRVRKRHLATVMIGSGNGNLSAREAVAAWMNGVRRALTNSTEDRERQLLRITFVEFDPRKVRRLQNAIMEEARQQSKFGLTVNFEPLTEAALAAIEANRGEWDRREWERFKAGMDNRREVEAHAAPTRVNLSLDAAKKIYRFGAITETAAVPERDIRVDPKLVMQANDELVGEDAPAMQLERGRFLEGLLIPNDLRRQLYSRAPLVLMLDATTARIHWEMVAQPEITADTGGARGLDAEASLKDLYKEGFLGTTRGLTRQLRTTFAPPPEPPPPPRRVLRILVVADPAADAHLPGAQEEGVAVADLFESYNLVHQNDPESSRVQVMRMFGPREATRTNVLRELMSRSYDVLHYAGHCVFQWDGDPEASGWVFNAGARELLSAFELNRIDRVPKFVFSNACESGITPDRSEERNAHLAPSFAEAFFNRGVSNFVCTAWPVDDLSARHFALTLYSRLLGLREVEGQPGQYEADPAGSRPMHISMRDARTEIADTTNGRTTWGSYQHYGSPYFQFFYPKEQEESRPTPAASQGIADNARKRARRKAGAKRRSAPKKVGAKKASKKVGGKKASKKAGR